jgi:hypothetical protein
MERSNVHVVERLKPKVHKVILAQLEELLSTEQRCDSNIREMEKMLAIMKREKQDISNERQKLEKMTGEHSIYLPKEVPPDDLEHWEYDEFKFDD